MELASDSWSLYSQTTRLFSAPQKVEPEQLEPSEEVSEDAKAAELEAAEEQKAVTPEVPTRVFEIGVMKVESSRLKKISIPFAAILPHVMYNMHQIVHPPPSRVMSFEDVLQGVTRESIKGLSLDFTTEGLMRAMAISDTWIGNVFLSIAKPLIMAASMDALYSINTAVFHSNTVFEPSANSPDPQIRAIWRKNRFVVDYQGETYLLSRTSTEWKVVVRGNESVVIASWKHTNTMTEGESLDLGEAAGKVTVNKLHFSTATFGAKTVKFLLPGRDRFRFHTEDPLWPFLFFTSRQAESMALGPMVMMLGMFIGSAGIESLFRSFHAKMLKE